MKPWTRNKLLKVPSSIKLQTFYSPKTLLRGKKNMFILRTFGIIALLLIKGSQWIRYIYIYVYIANTGEGNSIYKLYSESEILFAKIKHRSKVSMALQDVKRH